MPSFYGSALAEIHDSDYTDLARAAAATAISLLPPPADSGIVVDLGCGSGVTAEVLDAAGYSVVGIDASPDMISIARGRVPDGDFLTASIYEADIPDCQAVLAIGEVFNYTSDDRTEASLAALLRKIAVSLRTDGFLLCDVAGPGRAAATPSIQDASGDRWTMHVTATEDHARHELTRTITVDLAEGWQGSARSLEPLAGSMQLHETHLLDLIAANDFATHLEVSGLAAKQLPGYVGFELPVGWTGWLAQPLR
jgi:SAM-dependent methyltransferase